MLAGIRVEVKPKSGWHEGSMHVANDDTAGTCVLADAIAWMIEGNNGRHVANTRHRTAALAFPSTLQCCNLHCQRRLHILINTTVSGHGKIQF